jgi:glycosyltransferase involved in cell wall biosynthesis
VKILHVVPSYLPAVRYGGPIFAVHALCAALVQRGCDITVFTTNVDGPGVSPVPLETLVMMDGVKLRYFGSSWARRLYFSSGMAHALRACCSEFDLVHVHSVCLWPTWAAARAAVRAGVPYVISPRGMLVQDLIARKSRHIKRAWISIIERRNLERAAAIHVTSDAEAVELGRFGFVLPSVFAVPNGVSPPGADISMLGGASALPPLAADALGGGRPVVLYLGRINWKKGLDRLIRAIALVPDARLLVVGNDEENYTAELEGLARAEGVRDRVLFPGPVYGSAKAELFRNAMVFVLPSYSENFGNVVLEAMSEGCPVVVTQEVGAARIVEACEGGFVTAGAPAALADAIRRLLADASLREAMGRRGRENVLARYSWTAVAAQMLDAYKNVVAGGSKKPL